MVKGGERHFFHKTDPCRTDTVPVPWLRDARPAGRVTYCSICASTMPRPIQGRKRFNSTVKTIYSYYLPIIYLCSHALLCDLFTCVYCTQCTVFMRCSKISIPVLCTCLLGPLSPTPLWFVYWCIQCVLYCCVPVCQVLCLPLLYDGEAWSPNLSVETTRDAARTFLEKDITKRCYCHDLCIVLSIISAFNIPVKKFIFLMNTKLCWTNNAVSWGPFPYTWGY